MRLIYVTAMLPYGSREEYFVEEIRCLQMLGHQVLLVPRSTGNGVVREERRHLLPITKTSRLLSSEVLSLAFTTYRRSPQLVKELFKDCLETRNVKLMLQNIAVLPKAIWLAGLARKWKADGFIVQWGTTSSTMVMSAARLSGLPWLLSLHRGDIVKNNLLEPKFMHADLVRFVSNSAVRLALQYASVPAETASVVHMGVILPEKTVPVAEPPDGTLRIICPAMLLPIKGHAHLLRAIALLEKAGVQVTLTLAGDGPLRKTLEGLTKSLKIEHRVNFAGYVSHDRLMAMYARGDVDAVVLASVDLGEGEQESIPVALIEAMSYGIPVIATRTGGIEELLGEGAGMLIDPESPAAIAEAVTSLAGQLSLRATYGQQGRERVEREFNAMHEVAKMVEMFAETMKKEEMVEENET